ncbi:MAG: hypothetical protein ABI610_00760 [Acidobacteriota bacterium]
MVSKSFAYVPGHGAPGGTEILDAQLEYHRAVGEAASGSEGAAAIASRYAGYGLEEILPQSIAFWRERKDA